MDFRCHIITNPVDNDEKQSLMNAIAQSENLLKNFLNNACVEKDKETREDEIYCFVRSTFGGC